MDYIISIIIGFIIGYSIKSLQKPIIDTKVDNLVNELKMSELEKNIASNKFWTNLFNKEGK